MPPFLHPRFDVFTLSVMAAINFVIVSLGIVLASRLTPGLRGAKTCAAGAAMLSAGLLLQFTRVVLPGRIVVFFANVLVMVGGVILYQGLRQFRGLRLVRSPFAWMFAGGAIIAFSWYLFVNDNQSARAAIVSPFLGTIAVGAAIAIEETGTREERSIYLPATIGLLLYGLCMLGRTILALRGDYATQIFPDSAGVAVTMFMLDICGMATGLSMLLASNYQLRKQAETLAMYDPLTELPNRRMFFDRLMTAEMLALTEGRPFSVFYLDIDNFKGINDTYGHRHGDFVLKTIATRLACLIESGDCLARVGGDEFVVLTDRHFDSGQISRFNSALKAAVEQFISIEGREVSVQVSCGLAQFPDNGASGSAVVHEADMAMYEDKRFKSLHTSGKPFGD